MIQDNFNITLLMHLERVLANRKFWRKGINDKLKLINMGGGGGGGGFRKRLQNSLEQMK